MPKLPEELFTTDKLLYLEGFDGESQIPLMKQLAQIAQGLYNKYPEFCALVPFGSRTKGLCKEKSDIDVIVILNGDLSSPEGRELEKNIEKQFKNLGYKTYIRCVSFEDYKNPRTKYSVVDHHMYGPKLGPSRIDYYYLDEDVRNAILNSINNLEELGIYRKDFLQKKTEFLKNRRRLWEKRISSLLGPKEFD